MITRVFWPRNNKQKLELPDENYLNYIVETGNKISPSTLHKNNEEKDFPETCHHRSHMTSPFLDLRTQACQINY